MITASGAFAHDRVSPLAALALLCLASALLTVSSWISVPMLPVPMTMQTLAVTVIGAALGPRLGTAAVLVWLGQAAAGLPVLAGGAGGLVAFAGPTAGYLLAFPIAAAIVGALVRSGWDGRRPLAAFGAMAIGNGLCLAIGGAWLAVLIGAEAAVASGVAPFVLGGAVKAALGAALLCAGARIGARAG